MTDDNGWYVLESNGGAYITAGTGSVGVTSFLGPLSTRDGETRFSLRLWRAPENPDLMPEADRRAAREICLLAVGSADALAVELHMPGIRHQVGRHTPASSTPRTIRYNLGNEVTVHENEVLTASEAGDLFLSYFQTGTPPASDYRLRELDRPENPTKATHVLTIDFDEHRPVLPTVESTEFTAFLSTDDQASILVLWPIPDNKSIDDLTAEELSNPEEFIQTAGSSDRYTVEIRHQSTLSTLGHQTDLPSWQTTPTEITVGANTIPVHPHEVFTTTEVGHLFHHYRERGQIPENGYTHRELRPGQR